MLAVNGEELSEWDGHDLKILADMTLSSMGKVSTKRRIRTGTSGYEEQQVYLVNPILEQH